MFFDSHCHLDSNNVTEDPAAVLERARAAKVQGFLCVGVGGRVAAEQAVLLARRESDVWASVGVHPHDASTFEPELEQALIGLLAEPRVVGVGEVGLDFHYDHSPRET